jgi:hypothetical protein
MFRHDGFLNGIAGMNLMVEWLGVAVRLAVSGKSGSTWHPVQMEMAETVKGSKVATKAANLSGCGKLGNLGYLAKYIYESEPCLRESVEDGKGGQHCHPLWQDRVKSWHADSQRQ